MALFYLDPLVLKMPPPDVPGVRASACGFGDLSQPMTNTTADTEARAKPRHGIFTKEKGLEADRTDRTEEVPESGQCQQPPTPMSRE